MLYFFRFTGMQFYPFDWKNWRSILGLIINITLQCLFISRFGKPMFEIVEFDFIFTLRKPLFLMIIDLYQIYGHPLLNMATIVYYLLYSREIFSQLDQFQSFYNKRKYKKYFFIWFAAFNLFYLPVLYNSLQRFTIKEYRKVIFSYVLYFYNFSNWLFVIYYKFATYMIMKSIQQNLNNCNEGLFTLESN